MARIFKRCNCGDWNCCPHQWVVRYRTTGGRSSRQREQSFGDDLREAEDFALKAVVGGLIVWLLVDIFPHMHVSITWH